MPALIGHLWLWHELLWLIGRILILNIDTFFIFLRYRFMMFEYWYFCILKSYWICKYWILVLLICNGQCSETNAYYILCTYYSITTSTRWGGQKTSVFDHAQGIKAVVQGSQIKGNFKPDWLADSELTHSGRKIRFLMTKNMS